MEYDNRSKGYRIYSKNNEIIIGKTVKILENNTKSLEEKTNEYEYLLDSKNYLETEISTTECTQDEYK